MPRLSSRCYKAAKDYVDLRFNHWPLEKQQQRLRNTVKALKAVSPEQQDKFQATAEDVIKRSMQALVDHETAQEINKANDAAKAMLQIPEDKMKLMSRRHGGNMNAALAEFHANRH